MSSSVPNLVPALHPQPTIFFSIANIIHVSRTATVMGIILTSGAFLGLPTLKFYYTIVFNRNQAKSSRRMAQAEEMKAQRPHLDRFHAKMDRCEGVGEEEMQEGKRMERLFRRYLRSLEDDAEADDGGRSSAVKAEKWAGWF